MQDRVEKIRCDEPGCTCIVAERRADGTIVIRARHHGEEHVTIIPPLKPKTPRVFGDDAAVSEFIMPPSETEQTN